MSIKNLGTKNSNNFDQEEIIKRNSKILFLSFVFGLILIVSRLFYWQIMQGDKLEKTADAQYQRQIIKKGQRGSIFTSDDYTLVTNKNIYTLFATPKDLQEEPQDIANKIIDDLLLDDKEYQLASESGAKKEIKENLKNQVIAKLSQKESKWVSIKANLSETTKEKIEGYKIKAIGFDKYSKRFYPEASMAAHVTGFVGKDDEGEDIGYFGIEGALETELKARKAEKTLLKDALGIEFLGENQATELSLDGRDIKTTIRRDVQILIENKLKNAIERYQARSGEIIVMEPNTGKILGMAVYPHYSQENFSEFDPTLYKNTTLADLYEPGSTFKVLTVATGLDLGVITPETQCDKCGSARVFGQYTIKNWNDEYHPNINMTEALEKSDNTAMIFISEKIGIDNFKKYLENFKIGQEIKIDLQEDRKTIFPKEWNAVKLATVSFGQGIAANSLQVLRAINVIANKGMMVRPTIIEEVQNHATGEVIKNEVIEEGQIIKTETAKTVAQMMLASAQHGEAQWIAKKYNVAGKTGTSQVVGEDGYDKEKTIASFVGFAPPENPKYIMITKINEPKSSPWAAETAAPLWFEIAEKLELLLR